jgi:hypothetical protein
MLAVAALEPVVEPVAEPLAELVAEPVAEPEAEPAIMPMRPMPLPSMPAEPVGAVLVKSQEQALEKASEASVFPFVAKKHPSIRCSQLT